MVVQFELFVVTLRVALQLRDIIFLMLFLALDWSFLLLPCWDKILRQCFQEVLLKTKRDEKTTEVSGDLVKETQTGLVSLANKLSSLGWSKEIAEKRKREGESKLLKRESTLRCSDRPMTLSTSVGRSTIDIYRTTKHLG